MCLWLLNTLRRAANPSLSDSWTKAALFETKHQNVQEGPRLRLASCQALQWLIKVRIRKELRCGFIASSSLDWAFKNMFEKLPSFFSLSSFFLHSGFVVWRAEKEAYPPWYWKCLKVMSFEHIRQGRCNRNGHLMKLLRKHLLLTLSLSAVYLKCEHLNHLAIEWLLQQVRVGLMDQDKFFCFFLMNESLGG